VKPGRINQEFQKIIGKKMSEKMVPEAGIEPA